MEVVGIVNVLATPALPTVTENATPAVVPFEKSDKELEVGDCSYFAKGHCKKGDKCECQS